MKACWQVVVDPTTFETIIVLRGTLIKITLEQFKDKQIDKNDIMLLLLEEKWHLTNDEISEAMITFNDFVSTRTLKLPTN